MRRVQTAVCFVGTPLRGTLRVRGAHLSTRRCPSRPAARRAQTPRMGLINWVLISGWAFGAYRFFRGFNKTNYQPGVRLPLALAWPLFIVVNKNFRANFTRAIKASDDGF